MNPVTCLPAVSCNSFPASRPEACYRPRSEIKPDIILKGIHDIRERVACALSAKTTSVMVDRYSYSHSKLTARCVGSWNGKRLFAKILLADPYPVPPRFQPPWEAEPRLTMPVRAIGEQIKTEWDTTLKMRSLSGSKCVSMPLGRSISARTLVWEKAVGATLARTLKWSRWKSSMGHAGVRALFQAGVWLRSIHEASTQGMATIDVRSLIRDSSSFARRESQPTWHYKRIASRILEASLSEMGGTGTLAVPVAFTHGDFCLTNLLWENGVWRLAVVDFELSGFRPIYQDLFALVSNLQSALLNPLVPKSAILAWERSFWWGYGPISPQVMAFVRALALARVFYHHLSRFHTRRERKRWLAQVKAQVYRTFLEPLVIARRLDLPQLLKDPS